MNILRSSDGINLLNERNIGFHEDNSWKYGAILHLTLWYDRSFLLLNTKVKTCQPMKNHLFENTC